MSGTDARLAQLVDALCERGVEKGALTQEQTDRLAVLVRFSPRLTSYASNHPELLLPWLAHDALEKRRRPSQMRAALRRWNEAVDDAELAIRRFHRSEMIRIAWRDLCGFADIQEITEELSDLADVTLGAAYTLLWERHLAEYGAPIAEESGDPARMTVIGMGKQGGRELNFSSDVDVMFVYDDEGETLGADKQVSNKQFFTMLAQAFCDLVGKPSPEGLLYRIDTRLRPEGDSGHLAISLMTVEIYYHTYGRNWERQALLKARPIAGDNKVGDRFMRLITPFTYRKYVDEVEIAQVLRDIDAMRAKSIEEIGPPELRHTHFKNGYGGIRDIEFFVQAVQMLYGGQYPEIKLAGTLVSLQRMYESHLLHSSDYQVLSDSYRFLRRIEHRLQMVNEQQVYILPAQPEAQQRLADSMGYPTYDDLKQEYDRVTRRVREIYTGVFHREEWDDPSDLIAESDKYTDAIGEYLRPYEFEDPRQAFHYLKALQSSPDPHLRTKNARLFRAILPRLLQALKESPDADLSLSNFEKLTSNFRARTALLEELQNQPRFLDLLISVISGSAFLTRLVLRDPSLMETLANEAVLRETITVESLQNHLNLIETSYPKENLRDHLLRVQNAAMFRSGVRFLLGLTDMEEIGRELASIADFVLIQACAPVHKEMHERFPAFSKAHGRKLAILGYGKLGGNDFNVASDCDVVFVYDDIDDSESAGELSAPEFFQKWAVGYLRFLDAKSRLGFLYQPDARLRPHGKNSPLATQWNTFVNYYRSEAQLWERMALTRARFVTGNVAFAERLDAVKREALFSRPLTKNEVEEILSMREKIEREKGKEALKSGPGGLIDVEFIAQTAALHYGHAHPSLRSTNTMEIIRAASELQLLPAEDANQLVESYRFLREVENRLRIVNNVSLDAIPNNPAELEKLVRRFALRLDTEKPTPETFLRWLEQRTRTVRAIFARFFEGLRGQCH